MMIHGAQYMRRPLQVLLSMYKAKLYLAHRNIKAAKREIKAAVGASPPEAQMAPVILKANLEFMRGNLKKAQKLLTSISDQSALPLQVASPADPVERSETPLC